MCTQAVTVIDLRSVPAFDQGHVPGSISAPLDAENPAPKRQHLNPAIRQHLSIQAASWREKYETLCLEKQPVVLLCADGMVASPFVYDILSPVIPDALSVFEGGYRGYRKRVRSLFRKPCRFVLLRGKTGSGKSALLQLLQQNGYRVLDLEGLSGSRGSAFGRVGEVSPQPTHEHFENLIAGTLCQLQSDEPIFVEEELHPLGHCVVPESLQRQMQNGFKVYLDVPPETRADALVEQYGGIDDAGVIDGIRRLAGRIGQEQCDRLIEATERGEYHKVARELLAYYDNASGYESSASDADVVISGDNVQALYNTLTGDVFTRLAAREP